MVSLNVTCQKPARRAVLLALCITFLLVMLASFHGQRLVDSYAGQDSFLHQYGASDAPSTETAAVGGVGEEEKEGRIEGIVMPKLLNETAKAELGRHSWYLLHTMLARFPQTPTPSERDDLTTFIEYFAKLYPCGDCAAHFQTLLSQYPPQTSSRVSAAQWGCAIHNKVNLDLKKPQYDCSRVLENYDCGCGPD